MNKNKRKSVKPAVGIDPPERRFGSIAMDKGFIKADQLYEALMRQRAQETRGGREGRLDDFEGSGLSFGCPSR